MTVVTKAIELCPSYTKSWLEEGILSITKDPWHNEPHYVSICECLGVTYSYIIGAQSIKHYFG